MPRVLVGPLPPSVLAVLAAWGIALASGAGMPGCGGATRSARAAALGDEAAEALARGELDRAEAGLRLALEHAPGDAAALANLGLVALARGALGEAERHLRAAVAADEDLVEGWTDLGVVLERRGRDDDARRAYERALSIHPDRPEPRLRLALLFARQERLAEARAHLLRLSILAPDDAAVWGLLAWCELRLDRREAAGSAAREALDRDPDAPAARLVRAVLRALRGELAPAIDELAAVEADPVVGRDARLRRLAMEVLAGPTARTQTELATLLDADPFDPAVRLIAARAALARGALDEARGHARQARTLSPGLAAAWLLEAEACALAGDHDAARASLEAMPSPTTDAMRREVARVASLPR